MSATANEKLQDLMAHVKIDIQRLGENITNISQMGFGRYARQMEAIHSESINRSLTSQERQVLAQKFEELLNKLVPNRRPNQKIFVACYPGGKYEVGLTTSLSAVAN